VLFTYPSGLITAWLLLTTDLVNADISILSLIMLTNHLL
jgi:hypothetical protein